MLIVEGIYKNGKIEPLKPIPYGGKARVVITFLNEIHEIPERYSPEAAIKYLRGCDKGTGVTQDLLESRREDLDIENAKWQ